MGGSRRRVQRGRCSLRCGICSDRLGLGAGQLEERRGGHSSRRFARVAGQTKSLDTSVEAADTSVRATGNQAEISSTKWSVYLVGEAGCCRSRSDRKRFGQGRRICLHDAWAETQDVLLTWELK